MVAIPPEALASAFDTYTAFVADRDGTAFAGFHQGYASREEGYKSPLAIAAREALQLANWRHDLIGSGHLKQSVLRAIAVRVPWAGKTLPNNLVHWQQVQPFQDLPNAAVEQAIHDLFRSTEAPSAIYDRLRAAGVTYQIAAFLFFVKNPAVYLPITQERFDQAFSILGVQGFKTRAAKGWDNYAIYLDLIGQVRAFLATKLTTPVSLLDAHSFVYMIASQMRRGERDRASMERAVAAFQRTWPLSRVRTMTLEEYAQAPGNKDSFCHWVKERTKEAGSLGNARPAHTFGIYQRDPNNTDGKAGLAEEGGYLWAPSLGGATAQEAFEAMRDRIVATIEAAQANDLEAISRIDGFDLFRWKVAYLYAPAHVVPIYNRDHLKAAARELGMPNFQQASYAARHRYILANLPEGLDAFAYMHDFYERNRVEPERGVKYWVVGSSYRNEGEGHKTIRKELLKEQGIAIGYVWDKDLTEYYLDDSKDVKPLVREYYATHTTEDLTSALRAVPKFLRIAPGDVVALKGYNTQRRDGTTVTTIIGFARIVERDGVAYRLNIADGTEGLGHVLNAEFEVLDIERVLPINLADTVHEVDPVKNRDRWEMIFGAQEAQWEAEAQASERAAADPSTGATGRRTGTDSKNTAPYFVVGSSEGRWVRPYHNELQNSLLVLLQTRFPGDKSIKLEEDNIDILRIDEQGVYHLYEVKTDGSPMKCIRQALGQLLAYAALKEEEAIEVMLYVVGPQQEDQMAKNFLGYLKTHLQLPIEYLDHRLQEILRPTLEDEAHRAGPPQSQ